MLALILVAWVLSGLGSFVYWWTTEHDLTLSGLMGFLLFGVLVGPLAYIIGWVVHGDTSDNKREPFVVIKKRK